MKIFKIKNDIYVKKKRKKKRVIHNLISFHPFNRIFKRETTINFICVFLLFASRPRYWFAVLSHDTLLTNPNPNLIFQYYYALKNPKKMCSSSSSASPSSLFLSTGTPILRSRIVPIFSSSSPFINSHRFRNPRLCLSSSVSETSFEVTWVSPERNASDDYGGWAVVESPSHKKKKGSPQFRFSKPSCSFC